MLSLGLTLGVVALSKTLITFILVLGLLIFVHEFGHYIVAKWTGVRVEEFALGFGPKLFSFQKGETLYSLRAFPLGGFCKMTGEFPHAEEELEGEELAAYQAAVRDGRALYQKSVFQRFWVMFTGPLMNFLLAIVLFAIIFVIVGVPYTGSTEPIVGNLVPNQPAEEAGMKIGDRIVAINGEPVNEWEDLTNLINQTDDEVVAVTVERDGKRINLDVKPAYDEETDRRVVGIFPDVVYQKVGPLRAIWDAIRQTLFMMQAIIVGFYQMLTRQVPADVAGPVLIAKMVGEAAEVGWVYLLRLTAMISVNLGIINLVPFPALDGGRIMFLGIELVRGKAIDPEKEGFVHFIGFVILMALIAVVLYRDIASIF